MQQSFPTFLISEAKWNLYQLYITCQTYSPDQNATIYTVKSHVDGRGQEKCCVCVSEASPSAAETYLSEFCSLGM